MAGARQSRLRRMGVVSSVGFVPIAGVDGKRRVLGSVELNVPAAALVHAADVLGVAVTRADAVGDVKHAGHLRVDRTLADWDAVHERAVDAVVVAVAVTKLHRAAERGGAGARGAAAAGRAR